MSSYIMRVMRTEVAQCLLDSKEENLQQATKHVRQNSAGRAREHPSPPTPSTAFHHPVLPELEPCSGGENNPAGVSECEQR